MSRLPDTDELTSRVAREQEAAAAAKCERSRQAHLGLAQQYQQKLALVNAEQASMSSASAKRTAIGPLGDPGGWPVQQHKARVKVPHRNQAFPVVDRHCSGTHLGDRCVA
jgi:hypothetical protein